MQDRPKQEKRGNHESQRHHQHRNTTANFVNPKEEDPVYPFNIIYNNQSSFWIFIARELRSIRGQTHADAISATSQSKQF